MPLQDLNFIFIRLMRVLDFSSLVIALNIRVVATVNSKKNSANYIT